MNKNVSKMLKTASLLILTAAAAGILFMISGKNCRIAVKICLYMLLAAPLVKLLYVSLQFLKKDKKYMFIPLTAILAVLLSIAINL